MRPVQLVDWPGGEALSGMVSIVAHPRVATTVLQKPRAPLPRTIMPRNPLAKESWGTKSNQYPIWEGRHLPAVMSPELTVSCSILLRTVYIEY